MSKTLARATFKIILPGLVDRGWAVAAAIGVALFVGLSVLRIRRRFKAGLGAAPAQSDI